MNRPAVRRCLAALAAVAVIMLASACDVGTTVLVRPDGSGTYTLVLTAPTGSGGDPGPAILAGLQKVAANSGVPLAVSSYSAAGERGAQASFTFQSLADLHAESMRLAADGSGLSAVTISRAGTGWSYESVGASGGNFPAVGSKDPGGAISATSLAGAVNISVIVELPGAPAASNANAVTHTATTSTFTWIVPLNQPAVTQQATTTFVGSQASAPLANELTELRAPSPDSVPHPDGTSGVTSPGTPSTHNQTPVLTSPGAPSSHNQTPTVTSPGVPITNDQTPAMQSVASPHPNQITALTSLPETSSFGLTAAILTVAALVILGAVGVTVTRRRARRQSDSPSDPTL